MLRFSILAAVSTAAVAWSAPALGDAPHSKTYPAPMHEHATGHRRHRRHRHHYTWYQGSASWYDDAGSTACGTHYTYGFANLNLNLPCGAHLRMCHNGCVTATMQDHGPYVAGRDFDLNPGLKAAIGCDDLCGVRWRYHK